MKRSQTLMEFSCIRSGMVNGCKAERPETFEQTRSNTLDRKMKTFTLQKLKIDKQNFNFK
jgi:hypothetical protein